MIHPTATVEEGAVIGEGTNVWHYAHIRSSAVIGKNCVIGKDVYVDAGVKIGDRCKIENGVSVFKGVLLEDDIIVGPNVSFTNDLTPRAFKKDWEPITTLIRTGVGIGAGSVIICGVELGGYSMVGAGSIVTKDVVPYSLVFGQPARFMGWVCKCGRAQIQQGLLCPECRT